MHRGEQREEPRSKQQRPRDRVGEGADVGEAESFCSFSIYTASVKKKAKKKKNAPLLQFKSKRFLQVERCRHHLGNSAFPGPTPGWSRQATSTHIQLGWGRGTLTGTASQGSSTKRQVSIWPWAAAHKLVQAVVVHRWTLGFNLKEIRGE